MFETVVEPVLFRFEADQYTGWFAVTRRAYGGHGPLFVPHFPRG